MFQLYKQDLPSKWIDSIYGKVTYWDFLHKEKKRLEAKGRKAEIKGGHLRNNSRHTECYLLVNKIA